eukprot:CAMPEP_0185854296 /NCGR_PEP_ID=MMETSP1354-20130828/21909_1 /TAXON_ID=708628 /ORGANISM="Erythrolobus madagascarensis, Strain CCMP3276" /LENGTH=63 /DNA_ID=CAMNT_0028556021 /DNA_START=96 /DNA_END=287 /DNA_ORIENTATION=+
MTILESLDAEKKVGVSLAPFLQRVYEESKTNSSERNTIHGVVTSSISKFVELPVVERSALSQN